MQAISIYYFFQIFELIDTFRGFVIFFCVTIFSNILFKKHEHMLRFSGFTSKLLPLLATKTVSMSFYTVYIF